MAFCRVEVAVAVVKKSRRVQEVLERLVCQPTRLSNESVAVCTSRVEMDSERKPVLIAVDDVLDY